MSNASGTPKGAGVSTGGRIIHGSMNWEPVRKRLLGTEIGDALKAATELREGIEIVHTTEFPLMLSALLPAFSSILAHRTRPSADTTSLEHKLRNTVLEIISRMPSNEVLRPHAPHLVALSIDILNRDYEDNALLASRIIFDLYKVYRSLPQDYVQPYLDFVIASYRALPVAIKSNFAQLPTQAVVGSPKSPSNGSGSLSKHQQSANANPAQPQAAPAKGDSGPKAQTGGAPTPAPVPTPAPSSAAAKPTASAPAPSGAATAPAKTTPAPAPAKTSAVATTAPAPATLAGGPPSSAATQVTQSTLSATTPATKAKTTSVHSPESTASSMGGLGSTPPRPTLALRANLSFRCLCENPLLVMLKFQLYPGTLPRNIPVLINVMMEALSMRAPPMQSLVPRGTTMDANNKRHYFSKARELVAAQAKTLSFLTYLLRGFSKELKPYEDRLASNVVALMSTCPRESISTRKELLVATRHLLNSDFRTGFFSHVDALLDERVLMGCNHRYSEQTVLRPLAYTALSDLIHHVKTRLNMKQMSKVVCMFSRILHDSSSTLPLSTQYTSVRTLLSVVEIVFQNRDPDPQIGRDMLVRILRTLCHKLATLKEYFAAVKKSEGSNSGEGNQIANDLAAMTFGAPHAQFTDDSHHVLLPDKGDTRSFDGNIDVSDSWRDLRSMIRAIVVGHKTVIWYINNYRGQREKERREKSVPMAGSNEEVASAMLKMTNSERALVDRYILLALPCMKFLKEESQASGGDQGAHALSVGRKQVPSDQYRDVLSYFAAAFTTLDGYDLKRTLGKRLNILVNACINDSTVMVVPRHLLGSNSTTSYEFCAILLRYLVDRMDALSNSKSREILFLGPSPGRNLREVETLNPLVDEALQPPKESAELIENRASTYLQLFERVLKSLTVYPDNEGALRPYLRRIVSTCLRSSLEEADQWPDNYCMLLRYVFRSISAGKFEESYKELLPLIPAALNGLYRVIVATNCRLIRNTIIELCLTIPARLSSLLPHMNLLLRIIVMALSSNSGDLVNLGLRTLEFWVDNLNPDFLYPELSKQTLLFTELMQGLSQHLRPAPYPYGLLTLRLLGKLGGKNRRFLRDPIDVRPEEKISPAPHSPMAIDCQWLDHELGSVSSNTVEGKEVAGKSFALPLPLERCVERLRVFAVVDGAPKKKDDSKGKSPGSLPSEQQTLWEDNAALWRVRVEEIDFGSYCDSVMEETKRNQAASAFRVIRAALGAIVDVGDVTKCTFEVQDCDSNPKEGAEGEQAEEINYEMLGYDSLVFQSRGKDFRSICLGIMYGCAIGDTKEEASSILKGLATHIYYIVLSYHECFKRIDANGSAVRDDLGGKDSLPEKSTEATDKKSDGGSQADPERLGSLKPFGYFHRVGILRERMNPLLFNQAVAEFLAGAVPHAIPVGLQVVRQLISHAKGPDKISPIERSPSFGSTHHRGTLVFFENLVSCLASVCFSKQWNQREGVQEAICVIIEELGSDWGLRYEEELMNVAFFVVSSVPRELSTAVVKSFRFFVRLSIALYGHPRTMETGLIWDSLAVVDDTKPEKQQSASNAGEVKVTTRMPCTAVLQVVLGELASCKQIVRIAARLVLKHFIITQPKEVWTKLFTKQMSLMRRVIFSRSLRLLPLAEQVGAVEALSFMMKEANSIFPLSDQHLLAFLSELLKMSSVADGEMSDAALAGYVVDKNGNALTAKKPSSQSTPKPERYPSHASTIFFRRECIVEMEALKFVVPEELPHGVQIRVSSISLLRSVITGQPDAFFDAAVSTPIGNIRPHVISLLFRSLVSNPLKAVLAAHEALREVLALSIIAKENPEKSRSQSRLKSDLIQTCIRPVLLNLREHTRLSVPLLRGLSRLLSLLSSWFNKTLGEKLIDHLGKWTDPAQIKSHNIWTPGEEPYVAAAIIDLFSLLPHASHFVEPLVKTTIKLEAYLPGFSCSCVGSPYRKPLARYLNKHCQYTVGFFFQRLKAPIYSELFQHIVRMDECSALRTYLSGRQCSVMMLNVCFERPLAVIRSEKTTGTSPPPKSGSNSDTVELFHLHGIQTASKPVAQGETVIKQDLEAKKKRLVVLQHEFTKAKEAMQSASGPAGEEAKKQHKLAKANLEKGTKELNEAKQRYAAEHARSGNTKQELAASGSSTSASGPRPMNIESLELQHQGFLLVEALIEKDSKYFQEHNDVVRACRWLWRSKGRYLRLQHENSVAPRYAEESKILARFLMNYSKNFPSDVDVLFELIRIFLQPATTDFSFVRVFLAETVASLERTHQKQVIQRFFALLAGESTEETKALSIQLLLFPLLSSSMKQRNTRDKPGNAQTKKAEAQPPAEGNTSVAAAPVTNSQNLVDRAMVNKFVKEVLYDKGHPISCGDKLKVELLRVTNAMLEHAPDMMDEFQKEIIRFCWSLIKSEDALCKSWAYVVVCRLISLFETQAKYVLQVYAALLRSHQQEGRSLVRMALSLLVPSLKERLSPDDFKKSIESTSRIMFEDGSVPQLAHIWHTIVMHPEVYYDDCPHFVRYMVNSLNRLGLPPNSPPENRALAVSIIGLLIEWDSRRKDAPNNQINPSDPSTLKRKSSSNDVSPSKRQKSNTGGSVHWIDDSVLLDKSMVETIANFLVRLKVLLADPKVEAGAPNLDSRIMKVFRSVLATWPNCLIRPVYFEKVVNLCKEESALEKSSTAVEGPTRKAVKPTRTSGAKGTSTSPDGKKNDSKLVTGDMLCACLDIFSALIDEVPKNVFARENREQKKAILASCFRHVKQSEGASIRPKLHSFIIGLHRASLNCSEVFGDLLLFTNSLLEGLIASAIDRSTANSSSADQGRSPAPRGREKSEANDDKETPLQVIEFTLEIIEDVCKLRQDYFMVFSSSLLALGSRLVKKHLFETTTKQRQGMSQSQQSGNAATPQRHPTPTMGIIEQLCSEDPSFGIASAMTKSASLKQAPAFKSSFSPGMPLKSLVIIVRMMGNSNIPNTLSDNRKVLFHILSTILDSSDNVQLLMTAVKVVGGWLLRDGGGLTAKERNSFLWKIASFDFFNGLPDVESQPLADLVAHFVIKFLEERGITTNAAKMTEGTPIKVSGNDDLIIGRSLVSCLLNANVGIRNKLLSLYAAQGLTPSDKAGTSSIEEGDASNDNVVPRSGFESFWQLLHSDYEGLGGRCWNVVFVEYLLRSCVWKGGINREIDKYGGKMVAGHKSWLPPPRWKTSASKNSLSSEYTKFCEKLIEINAPHKKKHLECLQALQVLSHGDIGMCKNLLDSLLPSAWEGTPSDGIRLKLVPAVESLLSRPFHSQFFKPSKCSQNEEVSVNAIRLFLNALSSFNPKPLLDATLLVSLAENYNCWFEALSILEQQFTVMKMHKERARLAEKNLSAMRHCYRHIGDMDLWMSLAYESCLLPESKEVLAMDLYGMVSDASEAYSQLVEKYQADDPTVQNASDFELAMWEERWVELQRELCQKGIVDELASLSNNPRLLLESAWKSQDWDKVRQLVASPPLVAAIEAGDPEIKMCETLLAVANGKLGDVENSHAQAAQLCLHKWQQLPKISRGSSSHASLLHYFHRLVEVRESGQIMVETSNHSSGRTLPDLKNLLSAWRHRLPNDYERVTSWDDVFTWRTHMFSAITKNFADCEPNTLATLHDRPWTAIRIAKTARKQGNRDVALLLLNREAQATRSMDVTDAFLKLREQILAYDNPDSDMERTGGLNLINTTNLSFFDAPQKSELFRLKALFLASLGLRSKSNQAFCHSVQICPSHARAWVSWGSLCSNLGALTEKQMEQAAAKSGTEPSKETRANTAKKVAQYLAQSMGCYFEAIQLNTHEWSRIHLPKCLLMLVKDGSSPGVLCQTLENRGAALPPWVWLPWIPHLLSCLFRNEGRAVKAILARLVKSYPQAVYYALRAFYLERRDVERAKGPNTTGVHMGSVSFAEEMMSTLRRSHASLWSSLESILEELIVKFRPSYSEELLATITALIDRADSQPGNSSLSEKGKDDPDAMVTSVSKTLGRIAVKFFRSTSDGSSSRNDERARKTAEFKTRYKAQFEAEFKVSSSEKEQADKGPQFSLTEYLVLLKRWRRRLEAQVAATPLALPLMESSHPLSLFASDAPDLWPGACDPRKSSSHPDRTQSVFETDTRTSQSSTSSSAAAARKAASNAATAVASAAAKEGVGGDYGGGSACIEIPGQYPPNAGSAADLKPNPELHAKLLHFEPTVEVLRREQLVRRISMVGSDGKTYRFLLQFAIPYWTRTDERVAQTQYVLDKVLRKEFFSSRQHLSIQPNAVVPVAQRLRMTADASSRMSLDEIYKRKCQARGEDPTTMMNYYNQELAKVHSKEDSSKGADEAGVTDSQRIQVFRKVCSKADSKLLLKHMTTVLGDPESLFHFRRSFSDQLAANCLLQYAFSVAERTPPRVVFTQSNGRVQSPDFRVTYNSQGFIESRTIPFRMTPNLSAMVGLPFMNGRFITSFSTVAESVRNCKDEMDPILRLLMRDDIVAWYCKSMAKSDSKLQELEKQLADRVSKNVSYLQARFSECASRKIKDKTDKRTGLIDMKVRDLISTATSPDQLCTMPTSYQAWL